MNNKFLFDKKWKEAWKSSLTQVKKMPKSEISGSPGIKRCILQNYMSASTY